MTDKIIQKEIETEYKILTSCKGVSGNKNLYLIYNHVMNRKERKANDVKGTPTTMIVFNDQGSISTETLFSNGNKAIVPYFYPSRVVDNSESILIGRFMRGGRFTFGTIPLE